MKIQRHIALPPYLFWPLLFLAALSISTVALWWIILAGGNPFTVKNVALRPVLVHPGEVATVVREICTDRAYLTEYRPWLRRKSDGSVFMIQGGMLQIDKGCNPSEVLFLVPGVPPGRYEYAASLKFQNNLVGRDEHTAFPPMEIEVQR